MAKLTKKELREMEELEKGKVRLRKEMVESLQNYWKDVAAVERVHKIQGNAKVLTKEEKEALFNNYEALKGLTKNQIDAVRILINNQKDLEAHYRGDRNTLMKQSLPDDAIWLNDIVWYEEDLLEQLELFKRIGINKTYYTDRSTAALPVITWLTRANAQIVGITHIIEANEGLIFLLDNIGE